MHPRAQTGLFFLIHSFIRENNRIFRFFFPERKKKTINNIKGNNCQKTFKVNIEIGWRDNASVNSSSAHPPPPPPFGLTPGITIFFKKMRKFPGVGTHKLSKCPGVGTKKEGKCPQPPGPPPGLTT